MLWTLAEYEGRGSPRGRMNLIAYLTYFKFDIKYNPLMHMLQDF